MPITERLIGNVCNVLGEKASMENRRSNCRGSKTNKRVSAIS
jgi:hypothetical protein